MKISCTGFCFDVCKAAQKKKNTITIPLRVRSVRRREDHSGHFVSWTVTELCGSADP